MKKLNLRSIKPLQWVIIALSVTLLINICVFFAAFFDELNSYQPSAQSILYSLQSNNYAWLSYELGCYTTEEIAQDETLSEIYAIHRYFENSVYYHAYAETDPETAALYLAACAEHAEHAGDLSFYLATVDALFDSYA